MAEITDEMLNAMGHRHWAHDRWTSAHEPWEYEAFSPSLRDTVEDFPGSRLIFPEQYMSATPCSQCGIYRTGDGAFGSGLLEDAEYRCPECGPACDGVFFNASGLSCATAP
eukprot:jgi/Botrbrau1/8391/Bobra.0237s0013.2